MRLIKIFLFGWLAVSQLSATRLNPVSWRAEPAFGATASAGSTVRLQLRAKVESGYHLYSFTTPRGGPMRTTVSAKINDANTEVKIFQGEPNRHMDAALGVPVETFEGEVEFPVLVVLPVKAKEAVNVVLAVRYQACSDEICLAPVTREVNTRITIKGGKAMTAEVPAGYRLVSGGAK